MFNLKHLALSLSLITSFAALGCGGVEDDGALDDSSAAVSAPAIICEPTQCGPALGMPNTRCVDGSIGGPTGRCVANRYGVCSWQVRKCPAIGQLCRKEACGPALGMPSWICPDGSVGGSTGRCIVQPTNTCGWEVLQCR